MKKAKFGALEGVLSKNVLPILDEGDVGKVLQVRLLGHGWLQTFKFGN